MIIVYPPIPIPVLHPASFEQELERTSEDETF
jgi:hypothetical protein